MLNDKTVRGNTFTCFHAGPMEGWAEFRLDPPDVPLPARGKLFLRKLLESAGMEMSLNVRYFVKDGTMTTILEKARNVQRGEAPPPPIGRLLGLVLKVIEPGHAVFEIEAGERHHNPMGTLHGGVYCDLADAAMGYAYAATLG
jgi:hypothetical protein